MSPRKHLCSLLLCGSWEVEVKKPVMWAVSVTSGSLGLPSALSHHWYLSGL